MKPIEWRLQARHDAAQAAYWYARRAGVGVGERFLAQVDRTLSLIAQHPASGSTRHAAFVADFPAPLQFLRIDQFEHYLIYFIDLPDRVEVIRVWNASRGLDALMGNSEESNQRWEP